MIHYYLRVVVAEPGKPAEVREVENTLESMQALVGGHLECLSIWSGHDCWINEEGKLIELEPNRLLATAARDGSTWDVVGPLFVADHNEEGDTTSLTPDAAAMLVTELNGGRFCRPLLAHEVEEPRIEITEWTEDI